MSSEINVGYPQLGSAPQTHKREFAVIKVPYWLLTIYLFLLFTGTSLLTLYDYSRYNFEIDYGLQSSLGLRHAAYIASIVVLGTIPAVVSLILCIVNLARCRKFPEKKRRLTVCLCGLVLVNVAVALVLAIITALWGRLIPDVVFFILIVLYTILLFVPWGLAIREKMV